MLHKRLLVLPLLLLHLHANEQIDNLLNLYEEKSALHNKTKDESSGSLIVFTRSDLDKMQAYSLVDIFKSIRFFTLEKDAMGNIKFQRAGASTESSAFTRIYLNDLEMSSASFGSALSIFGEYDLGHIDHIEVYLGSSSLSSGNEYGFVTIKMYTKEPSREKGFLFGLTYGSYNSHKYNALTAGTIDDLGYLLYVNQTNENDKALHNKGVTLQRESQNLNFYSMLKREKDFSLELSYYEHNHDGLGALGIQKTPQKQKINSYYESILFTKYINSLKITLSYAHEDIGIDNVDSNGIKIFSGGTAKSVQDSYANNIYKMNIQNKTKVDKHTFLYGVEYQKKDISFEIITIDGVDRRSEYKGPKSIEISSLFGEYDYQYSNDFLWTTTLKYEHYKNSYQSRVDNQVQFRTGIVGVLEDDFTLKAFYSNNKVYPSAKEMSSFPYPLNGTHSLKAMGVETASTELIYTHNSHKFSLGSALVSISNFVQISDTNTYYNQANTILFFDNFVDYIYKINKDNKIMFEYYSSSRNIGRNMSPLSGGYVKLFNTFENLDFYNELVYRMGYRSISNQDIPDGYDLSSAITYHLNKSIDISLKGENLLNKALKSSVQGLYPVDVIERKVFLSMDISF